VATLEGDRRDGDQARPVADERDRKVIGAGEKVGSSVLRLEDGRTALVEDR
jgi:hypothetical protein